MPLTKVIPGMIDGSVSGGATNLITDGDAETGLTTNYIEGSYSAATRPAGTFTASSGTGTFAIGTTTTTPITGTRSFTLTKSSGASRQGRAIERTITIDEKYKAAVMDVFLDYRVVSGTFVAGSSTTDSSMIVYAAVFNGSTWTMKEPSSFKLLSNSTTLVDQFSGTFQTDADTTQIKFIFYVAETANSAWVVEAECGIRPAQAVYGSIRGPVGSIIATGSITPPSGYLYCDGTAVSRTTYSELFRVIGTTYGVGDGSTTFNVPDARGIFLSGAGAQTISSISYSRTLGTKQTDQMQGHYHRYQRSASLTLSNSDTGQLSAATTNLAGDGGGITSPTSDGTNGTPRTGTQTHPANLAVAYHICFNTGSVQMSDSTDTRVVSAKMSASTGQSLSTGVSTKISLNTAKFDSHGGVNTTLNRYTIQVAGSYNFTGSINLAVSAAAYELTAILYKNNTPFSYTSIGKSGTSGVPHSVTYSFKDDSAKTGDYYELYAVQDSGGSITARGDATANDLTTMLVERITGPSAIAASETVAAAVTRSTTQSAIANTVFTKIQFNNKRFDTHNAFDSVTNFRFNAPISGIYEFTGAINFAISAAAFELGAGLYINNVKVTQAIVSKGGTASVPSGTAFALMARMVAGDYAEIFVYQASGAALDIRGDDSDIGLTHLNIKRIGL